MKKRNAVLCWTLVTWAVAVAAGNLAGQAVTVTARLDANVLAVGQSTTLRIFAQVIPALRPQANRIVTWNVDVLNTNGVVATARYDLMTRSASDNDLLLSSSGSDDGANRLGIYDTFLNLAGAGVAEPVELLAVPIAAATVGQTRFVVRPGTGTALAEDFIVAPTAGGDPWTDGDYQLAVVDLVVVDTCLVALSIQRVGNGGPNGQLQLQFTPCEGRNHFVEARTHVNLGSWQTFPGGPHNSGLVTVTNSAVHQFFRVRLD